MNVKQLKQVLSDSPNTLIGIIPPYGEVPAHFHLTEVGQVSKKFIDCGGVLRERKCCVLQIWVANDFDHRLKTDKFLNILNMSTSILEDDLPIEVEYGVGNIVVYELIAYEYAWDLEPEKLLLYLSNKQTQCLAPDKCGIKGC